jgi:steroid delta-isomerase-like uncharacterized protein
MNIKALVETYLHSWNVQDVDAIIALFSEDGKYTDPNCADGLSGAALAGYINGLYSVFPDLHFETIRLLSVDEKTMVAEWVMRGTNSGSLKGLPPTGKAIALDGIDVFDVEDGRIKSVKGYFNGGTMMEQLGLQIDVQLKSLGPFFFGTSVYTNTQSKACPKVFAITQIRIKSEEERTQLRDLTRNMLLEISQAPGYIATVTSLANNIGTTLTAWEDMQAAQAAVSGPTHKEAMAAAFAKNGLGVSAWTSFWSEGQINSRWQRCFTCGAFAKYTQTGKCGCGAELDEPVHF